MQTPDRPTVLCPPESQPGGKANIDAGYARHLIYSIFTAGSVRQFLLSKFAKDEQEHESLSALVGQLRGFFSDNLAKTMKESGIARIDKDLIEQAENLALFEREFLVDSIRFQASSKPNPDAVFWPNPCHSSHPSSLFGARPMVENFGLMDKSTPVGSAGSCFASEIAYYLQNKGYNYVITESDEADGPQPGSCARWGLFFNTPSFKQLAEKAFGMRTLPKLAEFHPAGNYWQDPFRENIPFLDIEAIEANRDAHLRACRDALETCKVFFITLGLNECWEFKRDGAVVSRNPESPLHPALFRHRVLTVEENVENLQTFLDVSRANNPDINLVVTVSPVPLMATGRADTHHVVNANAHSKAVLRVAAENLCEANEGVYYFPSYEMVMHCLKDPWEADQRHVKPSAVAEIMKLFEAMFVINADT